MDKITLLISDSHDHIHLIESIIFTGVNYVSKFSLVLGFVSSFCNIIANLFVAFKLGLSSD